MKIIVEMEFGSRVYGTSVPTSDTDIKFLFQPTAKEILLGNGAKQITTSTKHDDRQKNTENDIDREGFSLQEFLKHVVGGQTFALDMLYTPRTHWGSQSETWNLLVENRNKLISKKVSAFVGYCRAQFAKYCVKAERLAAVEDVLSSLSSLHLHETVATGKAVLQPLSHAHPGTVYWKEQPDLHPNFSVLECCGRQVQLSVTVKRAIEVFGRVKSSYGERTRMAMDKNSVDWKALYHAIRVAREAEELLLTGHITFPRPEAALLLEVRRGDMPYDRVSELIEDGLNRVEKALIVSPLPEEADLKFIENLIFSENLNEVQRLRTPCFGFN